jgi:hypothetical protein
MSSLYINSQMRLRDAVVELSLSLSYIKCIKCINVNFMSNMPTTYYNCLRLRGHAPYLEVQPTLSPLLMKKIHALKTSRP